MPHPGGNLVQIEYARQFPFLRENLFASNNQSIVDETVRIDHVIDNLPLSGIRFDADLQRLHDDNYETDGI